MSNVCRAMLKIHAQNSCDNMVISVYILAIYKGLKHGWLVRVL